jgi:hypothetical protein
MFFRDFSFLSDEKLLSGRPKAPQHNSLQEKVSLFAIFG